MCEMFACRKKRFRLNLGGFNERPKVSNCISTFCESKVQMCTMYVVNLNTSKYPIVDLLNA